MTRRELLAALFVAQVPRAPTGLRFKTATAVGLRLEGPNLKVGETVQLKAFLQWSDKTETDITQFVTKWRSLNPARCTVNTAGRVTGLTVGTVAVEADYP